MIEDIKRDYSLIVERRDVGGEGANPSGYFERLTCQYVLTGWPLVFYK